MLEVWTQENQFCPAPSQRGLCIASASWPRFARCCVPCSLALPPESPPLAQPPGCFSAYSPAPHLQPQGQQAALTVKPEHLARLPPPWAKPSDTGETRAHSAGQHPGFLSKCLWLGFLLTEGRLQISSDIPRGGSQGPGRQARPAGTRCRNHGCTPCSCQTTFTGTVGSGLECYKGDSFGERGSCESEPKPGSLSLSWAACQSMPHIHPTLQTDRPPHFT